MSRLDDIEARLARLEAGGGLATRVAELEAQLGITSASPSAPVGANIQTCTRCGNLQNVNEFRCAQIKCPLKPQ